MNLTLYNPCLPLSIDYKALQWNGILKELKTINFPEKSVMKKENRDNLILFCNFPSDSEPKGTPDPSPEENSTNAINNALATEIKSSGKPTPESKPQSDPEPKAKWMQLEGEKQIKVDESKKKNIIFIK